VDEVDHWKAKTLGRFTDVVKYLKETIESTGSESFTGLRAQCCKSNVAIAFYGFFQTAQEKVNCTVVQFTQPGTIQHKGRSINIEATLKLAVESPLTACV
jgi:hypothetical protein